MPVSVIEEPFEIAFAENPNCWCFKSGNIAAAAGAAGYFTIGGFNSDFNPGINDTLVIEWNYEGVGYSVEFTFVNNPDTSGFQLPVNTGLSFSDYLALLSDEIMSNPIISDWFFAIVDTTYIAFTFCFLAGIQLSVDYNTQGNQFPPFVYSGVDQSLNDYEVCFKLYEEKPNTVIEKPVVEICKCPTPKGKYDVTPEFCFDPQKYLDALTREKNNVPSRPDFFQQTPWLDTTTAKKYILKWAEKINGVTQKFFSSESKRFVSGGLDFLNACKQKEFFQKLPGNKQWLTWLPTKRYVTCVQHNYLTFLNWDPNTDEVCLEITFNNNTFSTIGNPIPVGHWEKVHIPVGWHQLDIDNFTNGNFDKYRIRLVSKRTGEVLTQEMTFCLVEYDCDDRYFLYENSLGGWDSIRTRATNQAQIETEKTTAPRSLQCCYDPFCGALINKETTTQRSFTTSSGYLERNCNEVVFEELKISEFVTEVVFCDCGCCDCPAPNTGYYKPILVDGDTVTLQDTDQDTYKVDFTYREAWKDHKFTPRICPCSDKAGLEVSSTTEEANYCPVLPSATSRLYVRRTASQWLFLGRLTQLRNLLLAAGATNITYSHELFNTATGNSIGITTNVWGNPSTGLNVLGRMLNSVNSVTYQGTIIFDFNGHNICYELAPVLIDQPQTPPNVQPWSWVPSPEWTCTDKTPTSQICVTIEADDDVNGNLTNKTTEISLDNGLTWMPISLPYANCFDADEITDAILAKRTIETDSPNCNFPIEAIEQVWTLPPPPCYDVEAVFSMDDNGCVSIVNPGDFASVSSGVDENNLVPNQLEVCFSIPECLPIGQLWQYTQWIQSNASAIFPLGSSGSQIVSWSPNRFDVLQINNFDTAGFRQFIIDCMNNEPNGVVSLVGGWFHLPVSCITNVSDLTQTGSNPNFPQDTFFVEYNDCDLEFCCDYLNDFLVGSNNYIPTKTGGGNNTLTGAYCSPIVDACPDGNVFFELGCPNESAEVQGSLFVFEYIAQGDFNVLDLDGNILAKYRNNNLEEGGVSVTCCGAEYEPPIDTNPNGNTNEN